MGNGFSPRERNGLMILSAIVIAALSIGFLTDGSACTRQRSAADPLPQSAASGSLPQTGGAADSLPQSAASAADTAGFARQVAGGADTAAPASRHGDAGKRAGGRAKRSAAQKRSKPAPDPQRRSLLDEPAGERR